MQITFGRVQNFGFGAEFDILIDGHVVGSASKADDYPGCVFCTSGLDLKDGSYLPFEYEFSRGATKAKKEIRDYLTQALTGNPY